jgi:hypothetical protein
VFPVLQKADTLGGSSPTDSYTFFTRCQFAKTFASATVPAAYSQGSNYTNITSANVGNYIQNGAISNTQIGGDLVSTNWTGFGGTGWLLERNGIFYGNGVRVRGGISGGNMNSYAWPGYNDGTASFYVGAEGALWGNANSASLGYFQISANGAVSSRSFNMDASGNASFGGVLTANQVVTTANVQNRAVSQSAEYALNIGPYASYTQRVDYFQVYQDTILIYSTRITDMAVGVSSAQSQAQVHGPGGFMGAVYNYDTAAASMSIIVLPCYDTSAGTTYAIVTGFQAPSSPTGGWCSSVITWLKK